MGRLFEGRGWFYMGRLYVMSLRKPLRTRRGGGRVDAGWGRLRRPYALKGDCSVAPPQG